MVTLRGNRATKDSMTRVVVSDVQVLTAGTRYDQENAKEGKPIPTSVVTLLVTPQDGETHRARGGEGQIMLTLRNPMDRKPTDTGGVRPAALLGKAPAPPPVVKTVAGPPRRHAAPRRCRRRRQCAEDLHREALRAAKRSEEIVR